MTTIRLFRAVVAAATCLALAPVRGDEAANPAAPSMRLYVGTYTSGASEGIYRCDLDPSTGALSNLRLAAKAENASYLAVAPGGRLFAVSEVEEFDESAGGAVVAFAIGADGDLRRLNAQPSQGAGPCYVTVDAPAKNVLVANYGGGSVAVLPIQPDGTLGPATAFAQHQGSSINADRQNGPHAHAIDLSPDERFALAADLGLDKVLVYRFDPTGGTLAANYPPAATLPPGAGPRHMAFHPNGRWLYVINEMASTITLLHYDPVDGALQAIDAVGTLPAGVAAEKNNATAEIAVHPSGRFLYASNRGHDSIAVFAIDDASGRLSQRGHQPAGGRTPRNFALDPTGRFLLVANQNSDSITVHRIDVDTGLLTTTDHVLAVPSPVCIKFVNGAASSAQ